MHNNKDPLLNIEQFARQIIGSPSHPIYVLSPHLDDAIWSIGGLLQALAKIGYEITIVTLFSHSIFVYDAIRPPQQATTIRKGEDYNASLAANLKPPIFLDYADGILRDKPLETVLDSTYQTPPYLQRMIVDCLNNLLPSHASLLVPAAFGGHMDHLTTRRVAIDLPHSKTFFEDLPYALRDHGTTESQAFLSDGAYKATRLEATPALLHEHASLYNCYPSQTKETERKQIEQYLSEHGYGFWVVS